MREKLYRCTSAWLHNQEYPELVSISRQSSFLARWEITQPPETIFQQNTRSSPSEAAAREGIREDHGFPIDFFSYFQNLLKIEDRVLKEICGKK